MPRALLPVLMLFLALAAGCAKSQPEGEACACAGDSVVDPSLLAFLSKARAAHHEADLAEDGGDGKRAIAALEALAKGARPDGKKPRPEIDEVIADTRARLAELRSAGGDFDGALGDVTEGLALAPTPTHFRGHLLEVRGVVEERRAKAMKERGDEPGAERAKQDALHAFDEAIEVNDEVISRSLGRGQPAPSSSGAPRK
jgi:hypothetical protein